jgi:hypothetical protein
MPPTAKTICSVTLAVIALASTGAGRADTAHHTSIKGTAKASLQKESQGLFLHTASHSFQLAQFAADGETRTVLVESELFQRLQVTGDLGAKGDETGRVKLALHPIESSGQFGAISATRELPGDAIKLDSPSGITIITYGCCQENSAETQLSLASLKTLYVRSGGVPITTYTRLGKPALGRQIAVYLAMTAADQSVLGNDRSAVAMITVVGEDAVMQRMLVHLHAEKPREAVLDWSTEIGWRNASGTLDSHIVLDPGKTWKPVFTWKIKEGQAIELPLVDDRLDAAAAKLPSSVTLEAVSP